jgi:Rad3-related DNA helicase
MSIMKYFPLKEARATQADLVEAIFKAYEEGYKNVILEAPVGSGKSAVAVTIARSVSDAHLLTPMKSLQDQYLEDFSEHLVLMKGRNAYECRRNTTKVKWTCAEGLCTKDTSGNIKRECLGTTGCEYEEAIDIALRNSIVVHNLHSFIFQTFFSGRFIERELLVIDECHRIEEIIRGFATISITIPKRLSPEELEEIATFKRIEPWDPFLRKFIELLPSEIPEDSKGSKGSKDSEDSEKKESPRDEYVGIINKLVRLTSVFEDKFVYVLDFTKKNQGNDELLETELDGWNTHLSFTPEDISTLAQLLLFNFGEKTLLMSGTIYSKNMFCKAMGLNLDETCFLRVGSTFNKKTRPIYLKKEYLIDTSHSKWNQNFDKLVERIRSIFDIIKTDKGLIHTPSYQASDQLYFALRDTGRVVRHNPKDFAEVLEKFFKSDEPKVLLSPICQQGIDFKYNRARFQIILRVPYANTSDKFTEFQLKYNYPWYNHQALVTFGQQLGRVTRAEDDFGATILMDERFIRFIDKNTGHLPKWLLDSIIRN